MKRKTYQVICGRCGYKYEVQSDKEPKWELCPICGYSREFNGKEESKCQKS